MYSVDELNDRLIDLAFSEDIGDGDHTTLCCIPADAMGKSKLLIKEAGVLAGIRIAQIIFHRFDLFAQLLVFHSAPFNFQFLYRAKHPSTVHQFLSG